MRRYLAYLALGLLVLLALPPLVEEVGLPGARRYLGLAFALGGFLLIYALSGLGRRTLARLGFAHLGPGVRLLEALGYLLVLGLGLSTAGYHPTTLLAGGAVVGAIAGLAAQTTLANVLSGVVLLLSGAFRMGENIRIRSWAYGGVEYEGEVVDLTLVHTVLRGPSGEIRVPNARFMDSVLVRGGGLALEATLPSEEARRALEEALPGARFSPKSLGPGGLQGTLYLSREDVDRALDLLKGLPAHPAQG
jgi:small-conductance mechanosensitive channel